MRLDTFEDCLVQVHIDDADRRTVSVTIPHQLFGDLAETLGYLIQGKGSKVWFEAPMTRDRLKLQFVMSPQHGE